MSEIKSSGIKKFGRFLKKNLYYIILVTTLVAMMTAIMLSFNNRDTNNEPINVVVPTSEVATSTQANKTNFQLPVIAVNVIRDYSGTDLVEWKRLGCFAVHKAVDFAGESGSKVLAISDGTVLSVYTNNHEGTVVKIQHADDIVSVYASLDAKVSVKKGDSVKKGAQIGIMSNSMQDESDLGVHLHFSMLKSNKVVDPNLYLAISNK